MPDAFCKNWLTIGIRALTKSSLDILSGRDHSMHQTASVFGRQSTLSTTNHSLARPWLPTGRAAGWAGGGDGGKSWASTCWAQVTPGRGATH